MSEEKLVRGLDADGKKYTLPEADAAQFVASGGRVVSDEQAAQMQGDERHDSMHDKSVSGQLKATFFGGVPGLLMNSSKEGMAAVSSGVNAATFGFGDAAIVRGAEYLGGQEAGDRGRQMLKDRELSPLASGVGTVGGIAANMLVTAGASSLLEGGAIAKSLGGLSKLLPAGGEGSSAAKYGLSMLKSGAQGATESAIMGVGDEVSRAALENESLSAEKLLASAGHSGAVGGLTAGLLGGLFKAGGVGLSALRQGETKALTALAETEAEQLARRGEKAVASLEASAVKAEQKLATETVAQGEQKAAKGWLQSAADEQANKQAFSALGGDRGALRKIEKSLGAKAEQQVGDVLFKHKIIDSSGGFMDALAGSNVQAIAPKIESKLAEIGEELGSLIPKEQRIKLSKITDHALAVSAEAEKNVATINASKKVIRIGDDFERALRAQGAVAEDGTVALSDLFKQRQGLDKVIRGEIGRVDANAAELVKDFRSKIENEIIESIEKANPGEGLSQKFGELKYDYKRLKAAQSVAETGLERSAGNNVMGLRTAILGSALTATGGPLAGIAGAVGGTLLRDRGNAVAAYTLKKLAGAETVARVSNEVDLQLSKAARGLVGDNQRFTKSLLKGETGAQAVKRANAVQKEVSQTQADPVRFAEKLASHYQDVGATSPGLANELTTKTITAMNFLHSKAPGAKLEAQSPFSSWQDKPTEIEAHKYLKYVDAVDKPFTAFKQMERGQLSAEAVEALKVVHPQVFADLQSKAFELVAAKKAAGLPIKYEIRLKLGMLLDITTDPTMRPDVFAKLQAPLVATENGLEAKQGAGMPQKSIKLPSSFTQPTSKLDRLEQ